MSPPLPRRRSLAVLAVVALGMVLLSYTVILLIAALCVYLPYLLLMSSDSPGLQTGALFLCGVAMAGTMIWSLVPRRDKFEDPGPRIDRSSHPRLFQELDTIAASLNEPLPEQVFLVPQVNAFVADRGGIMGFGSRRVMGIGLPLVAVLNVAELRAVLAHEFAHYYGGDTRLGPFVYKTRLAMVRTIQNMAAIGRVMRVAVAQLVYRGVMEILKAYWAVFFRATQLISRRQEYRADELACHIAGSEALVSGLRKIHGANAAFPAYWNFEIQPSLSKGYSLPITEGFSLFATAPGIRKQIEESTRKELEQTKTTPYDSHPPLRDRIAAARLLPDGHAVDASSIPAQTLFDDLREEELRLLRMLNSGLQVEALKPVAWQDLPRIVPKQWRDMVKANAKLLGDLTPEGVPEIVSKLPEMGSRIPDPKGMLLTPDERTARAAELIATALALALVNAGWELRLAPGERYYQLGNERFSVREFLGNLLAKKISREEWAERCQALNIAGVRLADTATDQKTLFDTAAN
jgi:Zn-dependent protease with chaperone function